MENGAAAGAVFPSSSATASPQHSQWLHATLSDFEEKMKAMMSLVEEDDKKDDFCRNRKQQLVHMVGELNRSYSSLLHKYDELSLSLRDRQVSSFEYINKLADDLILTDQQCNMSMVMTKPEQDVELSDVVWKINHGEKESAALFQLKSQFTKLMEENLHQQAQLLRRNDEKRQTIHGLRHQLERLKAQHQQRQKCLHCSNVGLKRNPSKSTSLFLGSFFHGRC